jgi:hypothetical protein
MDAEIRRTLLDALQQYRGDDGYRARHFFKQFSDAQMDELHGASGKSRREILAEYEAHEKKVDSAVTFVETSHG